MPPPLPEQVDTGVIGQLVEPRLQIGARPEAVAATPGPQQRVLHRVLGLMVVTQDMMAVPQQGLSIAGDDCLQTGAVPDGERPAPLRLVHSLLLLVCWIENRFSPIITDMFRFL